jgi:hypothetical protein
MTLADVLPGLQQAKISGVAGDLSANKPALNAAVKVVFAAAARNK